MKPDSEDGMDQCEIRAVILHSNRLVRECLAYRLSQQEAISVVCSAARWYQMHADCALQQPDLFVIDFGGSGRKGLEDAQCIRAASPESKILMIGVPDNEEAVLACIEQGASGYLLEDASAESLVRHIRSVAAGETLCQPRIVSLAFSRLSALTRQARLPIQAGMGVLTKRERDIVSLIERGLSNKEIAMDLHIEVSTVKNHIHNILDKLQVNGRREIAGSLQARA
jgi:two-component system, NarL family, nitrate/nitrite response regulator NarL